MARVQVNDLGSPEAIQNVSRPNIAMEQASFDGVARAEGLIRSLASIQPELDRFNKTYTAGQERDADDYAASITVSELERRVRSGELPAGKSPVFVARLQRTNGFNAAKRLVDETAQGMRDGTLQFASTDDLDAYMVSRRSEFSEGQTDFGKAGFDSVFAQARVKLREDLVQQNSAAMVEAAVQQGIEAIGNVLKDVPPGATPEERAAAAMGAYRELSPQLVLPQQRKAVALDMAQRVAQSGDKEALALLLDSKRDEDSPSLRTVLGAQASATLTSAASRAFDDNRVADTVRKIDFLTVEAGGGNLSERTQWELRNNKDLVDQIGQGTALRILEMNRSARTGSVNLADLRKEELAAARESWLGAIQTSALRGDSNIPDLQVTLRTDGSVVTLKAEEGLREVADRIADNPGMSDAEKVQALSRSGLQSPRFERRFKGFVDSIMANVKEAPPGPDGVAAGRFEMTPEFQAKYDWLKEMDAVNPAYTRSAMGLDDYEMFTMVDAAAQMKGGGVADAMHALALRAADRSQQFVVRQQDLAKATQESIKELTNDRNLLFNFVGIADGPLTGARNVGTVEKQLMHYANVGVRLGLFNTAEEVVEAAKAVVARNFTVVDNIAIDTRSLPPVKNGEPPAEVAKFAMQQVLARAGRPLADVEDYSIRSTPGNNGLIFHLVDTSGAAEYPLTDREGRVLSFSTKQWDALAASYSAEKIRKAQALLAPEPQRATTGLERDGGVLNAVPLNRL